MFPVKMSAMKKSMWVIRMRIRSIFESEEGEADDEEEAADATRFGDFVDEIGAV